MLKGSGFLICEGGLQESDNDDVVSLLARQLEVTEAELFEHVSEHAMSKFATIGKVRAKGVLTPWSAVVCERSNKSEVVRASG